MWYIIKDLTIFNELSHKNWKIPISTYYNARKWKVMSDMSYRRLCKIVGREIDAVKMDKKWQWFRVDVFLTDLDMNKRNHNSFHSLNPEEAYKFACNFLHDPDNLHDILKMDACIDEDEDLLNHNPEINEDRNETPEWKLQDDFC